MILLILFSFLAGVVTILSPCILPILPIILSSGFGDEKLGKSRPLGVIVGFILSFTFFTLFLSTIVKFFGISSSSLRIVSIVVIFLFGISFLIPKFQQLIEILFAKFSRLVPQGNNNPGFIPGVLIGLSLGLLWTPCVGPILASVISLALTGTVTFDAFIITLAYSVGTAIPMLIIMTGGQNLMRRVPWLLNNASKIQKAFGVVMILTAVAIYFNLDRSFQKYILDQFPNYGKSITKIENNNLIRSNLEDMDMLKNTGSTINAPEIIPGGEWFNSEPLKIKDLKGKVVLVDFWTYTCINCIRTLPYIQKWHEKYKDQGLVIIGVHTPEFEFEKSPENVSKAIKDFGLTYPIVQDNNYQTWNAYSNHYWPAKYLINKDGKIVDTHFGEGDYDETEKKIQFYLKEAGFKVDSGVDNPDYQIETMTPELYLGYGRMGYFAEPEQLEQDVAKEYTLPKDLPLHHFAFGGKWTIMQQYAQPSKDAQLVLGFESKNVFLVMRPKGKDSGKIKVYLDGKEQKEITIDSDKLYELVKLEDAGKHYLKIEFLDSNTEVYAFTFG